MPKQKGFTLIELMVVIAIIAILATIGIAFYSTVQQKARDSKRQSDIKAMSDSMESHYQTAQGTCPDGTNVNGGTYCSLQDAWFSSGGSKVPTDPTGGGITTYCLSYNNTNTVISNPAVWTSDCTANGNGVNWTKPIAGTPTSGSTNWKICATMESAGKVFCLSNQQQ